MNRLLVLLFPVLAACNPVCSGVMVAPDVVVTAGHCVDGLVLYEATVVAPVIRVGDQLRLRGMSGGDRMGTVLRIEDGEAYMDVEAIQGDSGGPVTDSKDRLVGVIVSQTLPEKMAVVRLLAQEEPWWQTN